jgi:hypothetical protein
VTVTGTTSLHVDWDDVANATTYELEVGPSGGPYVPVSGSPLAAPTTSFDATGLTPNTQRCFRVRTNSLLGTSSYSSVVCATTDPLLPTYISNVNQGTNGGQSGVSLTAPTRQSGDRLFVVLQGPNAISSTAPTVTGWTLLRGMDLSGSPKFGIYTRIANNTSTDNFSCSWGVGAVFTTGSMVVYRNASTISVACSTAQLPGASNVQTRVGQTAVAVGSVELYFACAGNAGPFTHTGGGTSRVTPSITFGAFALADAPVANGATGPTVSWSTPGNVSWVTYTIILTA